MPKLRKLAVFVALSGLAAGAAAVVIHRSRAQGGVETPGGIIMSDAAGYDTVTGRLLRDFYRSVAADVARVAPEGGRVLEVGCGPGHLSIMLARDYGLHVSCADIDPAMIERARANAERNPGGAVPGLSFAVADVAAMPFPNDAFDLVVSTLSMHHWADPAAGQAEIARLLRPGGRALIWDIRPGAVPFHGNHADPLSNVDGHSMRLVGATPWYWPWHLKFTQRLELEPVAIS